MWKTKQEITEEALNYDNSLNDNVLADPDYCVRGMVWNPETDLYIDFKDYSIWC